MSDPTYTQQRLSSPEATLRLLLDAKLNQQCPGPSIKAVADAFCALPTVDRNYPAATVVLYRGRAWVHDGPMHLIYDRPIINLPALGDTRQGPNGEERFAKFASGEHNA